MMLLMLLLMLLLLVLLMLLELEMSSHHGACPKEMCVRQRVWMWKRMGMGMGVGREAAGRGKVGRIKGGRKDGISSLGIELANGCGGWKVTKEGVLLSILLLTKVFQRALARSKERR